MSDIPIVERNDDKNDNSVNQDETIRTDQKNRVQLAKNKIVTICKQHKIGFFIQPKITVISQLNKLSDKQKMKNVQKTIKRMDRLFKKYGTYLKANPVIEIRPIDRITRKTIIPKV